MSVYHQLLHLKEFREEQAATEVRRNRALLADAKQAADELQRKLEQYRQWCGRRERELIDDLCSRIVKLREIEDLRTTIADMHDRERNLEQGVVEAEERRHSAARELDAAIDAHNNASRKTKKFQELARIYSEEARREMERQEDLEMEEFRSMSGENAEWEAANDDTDAAVH